VRLDSVLGAAGDQTLASGYITLGWSQYWCGNLVEGMDTGERAVTHARRSGRPSLVAEALKLAGAQKLHGEVPWPEVRRHADEMDAAGVDSTLLRAWADSMEGRHEDARRTVQAFIDREHEHGRVMNTLMIGLLRGHVEITAGDYEHGELVLRDSWDGLGALGERGYRSTAGGYLGELLARRGKLDEAEAVLDASMEISTPDDWVTVAQVLVGRAFVASGQGDHDQACRLGAEAVEIVDGREYLTLQSDMRLGYAELLLAAGRDEEARAALGRAREAALRKGSTLLVERVDRLLAGLDA
jgi:tetratricopeptide (TPR) repeat protein